jgi:HEAT repeat protein
MSKTWRIGLAALLVAMLGITAWQAMAAKSLGIAGTNNDVVIPALTKSLRDGSPKVREAVATALLKVAPEAAAKAGVQ